ncbi:MAG: caspase family protein, partial [Sphingobacteriales bacterium]
NDKDSLYNIYSDSHFTAFEASRQGEVVAAGTKDSGWYFIPTVSPDRYIHIPAAKGNKIDGFYFDDDRQHMWVEESYRWYGFRNLTQYDYSSGQPVLVKTIPYESFGLSENNDAVFAFDFKRNKVYVKSVIRQLVLFDLTTETISADLSWPGSQLSAINKIYFNRQDDKLYIAAEKFDASHQGDSNFVFTLQKDSLLYSNVINPSSSRSKDNLFPPGMHTAVNKLPGSRYASINQDISLSNDLALLPSANNEYLLYESRSGNMIHSFQAVNLDLDIQSRFVTSNTAQLSPDGKSIFEWLVKAGAASGISDTLQMALTQLSTGSIKRNRILLTAKDSKSIRDVSRDAAGRPLLVLRSRGVYPEVIIEVLYLDSLLLPHPIADYKISTDEVIYDAWNITGTTGLLTRSASTGADKTYHYNLYSSSTSAPELIKSSAKKQDVLINKKGFLLMEENDKNRSLSWYNAEGKLLHTSSLSSTDYRLQRLAHNSSNLYLTAQKSGAVAKLDLLSGNITPLESVSKAGFRFAVSPDEKLLLSADETIDAWKIAKDTMHKLYQLKAETDFLTYSQVDDKRLISDGRVWNFETGQLTHTSLASLAAFNDSILLATAGNYEVLQYDGLDDSYSAKYAIAPHRQLFSRSLAAAKDLGKWNDKSENILLVTRHFNETALRNIYELPLSRESLSNIKIYPSAALNTALIVKSATEIYGNEKKGTADTLLLLNLATGKTSDKQVGKLVNIKQTGKDGAYLLFMLNQKTNTLQLYKTGSDNFVKVNHAVQLSADSIWQANIADENNVVYSVDEGIVFRNLQTGVRNLVRFTYLSGNYVSGSSLHYDADSKALYVAYSDGGVLKIEDNKVSKAVQAMPSAAAIVGKSGNNLVLLDKLGHYYFLNQHTLERELSLYTWPDHNFSERKYIWLTKENYYMASPGIEKNIHFVKGSAVIPLKQGDLQYNRPDKVLEYLGAPKSEIDFYRELHGVRLRKYKNTRAAENDQPAAIDLKVAAVPAGRQVALNVEATGKNNLSKLNVTVNGCPLPIAAFPKKSNRFAQQLLVDLNAGDNTIFTWVEDETGAISGYDEQKIVGEFADSGKWHFVGIGVSQYMDSQQNLKYADKDIRDIATFLAKQYPGITVDTLLNENVTKANIERMALRLKNTRADDKVMVSFSGHGLLDGGKKFFYGTHDIDFKSPAAAGFSMADITVMLEHIPARYRMITLDACHSGDDVATGKPATAVTQVIAAPAPDPGVKGTIV